MKKPIVIVAVLLPLLLGGGVVGAAMAGVINIPGLTPKKGKAANLYGDASKSEPPAIAVKPPVARKPPQVKVETTKTDPVKGDRKVASIWNNLPVAKLVEMSASYSDQELARIVLVMDPEVASKLVAALESKRSAALSKQVQELASLVPKASE